METILRYVRKVRCYYGKVLLLLRVLLPEGTTWEPWEQFTGYGRKWMGQFQGCVCDHSGFEHSWEMGCEV